jgi:hypothetical protein
MTRHAAFPGMCTGSSDGSVSHRPAIIVLMVFGLLVLGAFAPMARAETPPLVAPADSVAAPDTTALHNRVLAYYFHTTKRCVSCRKIEAYTTEAIQTGFAQDLKDGRLVFTVVNVEDKGNEHFVKDYQLFTKSVVLVDERSGKQAAWKNLPKVWELLNDKEKFVRYIQEETRGYLTGKHS